MSTSIHNLLIKEWKVEVAVFQHNKWIDWHWQWVRAISMSSSGLFDEEAMHLWSKNKVSTLFISGYMYLSFLFAMVNSTRFQLLLHIYYSYIRTDKFYQETFQKIHMAEICFKYRLVGVSSCYLWWHYIDCKKRTIFHHWWIMKWAVIIVFLRIHF